MSLNIDGVKYYSMTEVAEKINVHRNTLRIWEETSEELEAMNMPRLIPKPYYYGQKGIRYWNDKDIVALINYRDTKKYGKLSSVTRKNRGIAYSKIKPNQDRNKNIVYYHSIFDFEKFLSHHGFLSVKTIIDIYVKSCVVIADGKAFTIPFELLEKENKDDIKNYLLSKINK